jgi:nucleotide-binding universal stress UspA family protein
MNLDFAWHLYHFHIKDESKPGAEPMKKHLLLTISHDQTALDAVRFASTFFRNKEQAEITLLYIAPNPKQNLDYSDNSGDMVTDMERLSASYQKKGNAALHKAAELLVSGGFDPDTVKTSLIFRSVSTATDIAVQANKGMYDAVLLGRRGLSLLEELVEESVSKKILEEGSQSPLWFCRKPEPERENVLLCTDGSRESLCIADHIGFMLEHEPEHRITILNVQDGSKDQSEAYIAGARQELINNNIPEERINALVIPGKNPSRIIMDQALKNNYAAIGMGRRGRGNTGLSRLFMGSTTQNILKSLEKVSLWVCSG